MLGSTDNLFGHSGSFIMDTFDRCKDLKDNSNKIDGYQYTRRKIRIFLSVIFILILLLKTYIQKIAEIIEPWLNYRGP